MTVRWKPLLILSGLFLVIALVGLAAMAYTLVPRGAADILLSARADRSAQRYDNALVHYRRALQRDGRNPAIHEELAAMFAEWIARAPGEKKAELRAWRLAALMDAAKYGKILKEPRRQLLADALQHDGGPQSIFWAKELLRVDPANAEAHYVMAVEALEERNPNIPEVQRGLAALQAAQAPAVRVAWVKARIAQLTNDDSQLQQAQAQARTLTLADGAGPADCLALVRLRALDVQTATEPAPLPERVEAFKQAAGRMLADPATATAPGWIMRLSAQIEQIQRALMQRAATAEPESRGTLTGLVEALDADAEAIFTKALKGSRQPDLQLYLTYADHLRFRGRRDQCLKVIDEGLRSPAGTRKNGGPVVLALHAMAAETALANAADSDRRAKAAPHIQELLGCSIPRYQGLGHLFQGAIDLEQAGVATAQVEKAIEGDATAPPMAAQQQARLRTAALGHLKAAAAQLPDIAEAQARYGVALVLAKEQGLGRQYLQKAVRQGNLDPQYQIWAAWSMVQAGYPEEAEPIVAHLFQEIGKGRQPETLAGTLHLLSAEIHQARRTPEELNKALAEYDRSIAAGQPANAAIQLRLAQIDAQLGRPEQALKRIESLRAQGQGGPGAEQMAVMTLQELGKADAARAALDQARRRYPRSDELVSLDASFHARANQPKEADRVLAEFLAQDPENVGVTLLRAQVLADLLGDVKEARKLLINLAERSDNSAPLVQLALLDLKQKDYDAVATTVAKIRNRWKESAAADLLEAQLALDQGNLAAAAASFDAALQKDPSNKMVLYWKAQLDSRTGAAPEAARTLETIVQGRPTKELEAGLSLTSAAESALANLALARGDLDAAIERLEDLRGGSAGALTRSNRWQLVSAYAAKGQWDDAQREMTALLNDLKAPPTNDERVRAAHLYHQRGDEAAAEAQLAAVLKVNPAHPAAVVTQAYLLAEAKKLDLAATLLRQAIAGTAARAGEKPPAVFFLMLAAIDNQSPPADSAPRRALATLDQGLEGQPRALELVKAKYQLLRRTDGARAAVAFVESKARAGTADKDKDKERENDDFRRLLVEVYAEQKDYAGAERVLLELLKKSPKDATVAVNIVRLATLQSIEAAARHDQAQRRAFEEKAARLIREFRAQFPADVSFVQLECDLAARRGDFARATALTQEMDGIDRNSTAGPLTRARLYAAQGRTREVTDAYAEALERNPRQLDVRIQLGRACLRLGEADEALRQAKLVLDVDKDRPEGLLLQAMALAEQPGPEGPMAARRSQATALLWGAIKAQPRFVDAYHAIAEIEMRGRHRDRAVDALKAALKAVPDDAAGLARLVELLTEPREDGSKPAPAALAEARALADLSAAGDTNGNLLLALATGFHKAGQLDLALPWAEKAAARLDAPAVHLNYGDLLLSVAEAATDPALARTFFRRAVAQYDLVLETQASSVEAINNKAWILHNHLGDSRGALELALGLLKRADPATLPGEFFDTLGAVQEATGRTRDAEESYTRGLHKAPDHPVLNFHMGKLLLAEHNQKAIAYLEKAYASRGRLSPKMADEVASLMKQAGQR
jgi:predicted Zn-dependent protease